MNSTLAICLSLLTLSAFSSGAMAAPTKSGTIEEQIAKDINGLFGDTYNEGEGRAEVYEVDGKPQIKCSSPRATKNALVVFCTAQVQVFPTSESDYSSVIDCTGLSYALKSKDKIEKRYNDARLVRCLENANDVSE